MPMTVTEIMRRLKNREDTPGVDSARILSLLLGDVRGTIQRAFSAFVPRTAGDLIDEWFPWARDHRIAMDPGIPEAERMAALRRLVSTVRWSPNPNWGERERDAWQILRERAEAEGASFELLRQELLGEAAVLVLGDQDHLQRLRVGSGSGSFFLRESDDADTNVRPVDLPYSADPDSTGGTTPQFDASPYLYWFDREVQRAATAILLDEPYPPTDTANDAWKLDRSHIDPDMMHAEEYGTDPLLQLLESEHYTEQARRLIQAFQQSSPQQREILSRLADGDSIAQAARDLGITPGSARAQLKRVRDKTTAV